MRSLTNPELFFWGWLNVEYQPNVSVQPVVGALWNQEPSECRGGVLWRIWWKTMNGQGRMDKDYTEWNMVLFGESCCFSSEMGSETMGKGSPRPMKFESQPKYLYFDSLINGNPQDILTNFTSGSGCWITIVKLQTWTAANKMGSFWVLTFIQPYMN